MIADPNSLMSVQNKPKCLNNAGKMTNLPTSRYRGKSAEMIAIDAT